MDKQKEKMKNRKDQLTQCIDKAHKEAKETIDIIKKCRIERK